ncbi:MAG: hypothetical protein EA418_02760 [Wenzhouxiangellaceae bacterium]|nr:MAG: hypothetical protein EA418_02760 [Wenzhouxiangellaceae bacterium]
MKLARLEIRRLPGIDEAFSVDFEPGAVNVVTGPNASGKSSLVRAVRALLYPDDKQFSDLAARWHTSQGELLCERHGVEVSWLADGRPTAAPTLPGRESIGAFLVSSEDLAALGSTDAHISASLRTMLAGGYDLDAALSQAPLASRPRPQKMARDLSELSERVAAKENEYAKLHDDIAQIDQLRQQLIQTRDAGARLRACEDAIALAETFAHRKALESTLIEEFPGGMDRLKGDELDRLERIESAIAERERELAIEQGGLRRAREQLDRTGSISPQDLEALQSSLDDQRDALTELERQIEAEQERIAGQDQALQLAARRLGSAQAEPLETLDQDALESLEKLVDRVQVLREQIRNLTGELARAHSSRSVSGRPAERLRRARQALQRWLDGARLSPLEGVLWGGLSVVAVLASWRLLGPQDSAITPELILLILLAVGIPASLLIGFLQRWRERQRAQLDFMDTDIEAPLGWTEEEVEARIERLDLELESATRHEISQARAADVREQLNSQRTALDKAREKLKDFAEALGISADSRIETGFQLWCRHLHDWQNEQSERARAQARLAQIRQRYGEAQTTARDMLERHGMAAEENVSSRDVAGLLHLLAPRMRRNTELHNDIRAHERRVEELQTDIAQHRRQLDAVYEEAGVKVDARDVLVRRVDRFADWQALEQQRRAASLEIARLEERLSDEQELLSQARTQQREALESRQAELREAADQRDRLNQRIAELETRHEDVLKRRELEGVNGEYEAARNLLEAELDRQLLVAAAESLVESVRTTHQADNEPAALALAGQWLDRFTHHRYQLGFEHGEFTAIDSRDGRRRRLGELSTGTRVQLLLAVRLAWIQQAEAEADAEPLPVFLDEVLTTTDPDRYRAIVQSIQEIVIGGRQVFYLTAQSDDAAAWAEWIEEGPPPHRIDMAEVRSSQVQRLQYELPRELERRREIPDPGGMDPLEWADAAGVDAIDPWRDAGTLHVFHLLHDRLDLCAELMGLDLARLGQLEAFLASGRAGELLDREDRQLLGLRARAARQIIVDWQLRRDRPVDEATLHACGLISDSFMPRVMTLTRRVGGHPRQLLEALRSGEVSRFRSDSTEQLETWLRDAGYLNEEAGHQRLSAAQISTETGLTADRITDLRAWINGAIIDPLA